MSENEWYIEFQIKPCHWGGKILVWMKPCHWGGEIRFSWWSVRSWQKQIPEQMKTCHWGGEIRFSWWRMRSWQKQILEQMKSCHWGGEIPGNANLTWKTILFWRQMNRQSLKKECSKKLRTPCNEGPIHKETWNNKY